MLEPDIAGILKEEQYKKTFLWLIIFYIGADLIAFVLGIAYILIVVALLQITTMGIVYYRPIRKRFFMWLSKDENFDSPPPFLTWWRRISIILKLILYTFMLGFGFWIILHDTFFQQNLIWLLMQHR